MISKSCCSCFARGWEGSPERTQWSGYIISISLGGPHFLSALRPV